MSKIRENLPGPADGQPLPAEPLTRVYEVFLQPTRNEPHVQVGSVNAADDQMALDFARETFGRRQACAHIWVVRRDHLVGTVYGEDFMERACDRGYREARGYQEVRRKWEQFRRKGDVDEYQKDDLKEAF